jgi:hypothetical protein
VVTKAERNFHLTHYEALEKLFLTQFRVHYSNGKERESERRVSKEQVSRKVDVMRSERERELASLENESAKSTSHLIRAISFSQIFELKATKACCARE